MLHFLLTFGKVHKLDFSSPRKSALNNKSKICKMAIIAGHNKVSLKHSKMHENITLKICLNQSFT